MSRIHNQRKTTLRNILAITGIRSEYDIQYKVFRAIEDHESLSLKLIVTGAHLSEKFGMTIQHIRRDGFEILAEVPNLIEGDLDYHRLQGAAIQLQRLAKVIHENRPDLLLVLGDREEAINVAYIGAYLNIPVAHISGGDRVVGNVDDHIRHATSKLAHLHFTTNQESANRLIKMGEEAFRVFNVGNPGLDRMLDVEDMDLDELNRWYDFPQGSWSSPLLLVIQHPISSNIGEAYPQMKATLDAIAKLQFKTVISYPNSDPGSLEIIQCIQEYTHLPFVRAIKHIPRKEFINTLRQAQCMIGNSSAGILEAPFLKLPVVNVGMRQKKRLHGNNVQFVPHEAPEIEKAIKKACFDENYRNIVQNGPSPYGDGHSSEKIASILASIPLDKKLLLKDITY